MKVMIKEIVKVELHERELSEWYKDCKFIPKGQTVVIEEGLFFDTKKKYDEDIWQDPKELWKLIGRTRLEGANLMEDPETHKLYEKPYVTIYDASGESKTRYFETEEGAREYFKTIAERFGLGIDLSVL